MYKPSRRLLVMPILLVLFAGCVFDDDDKTAETGSYAVSLFTKTLSSYPKGGGLVGYAVEYSYDFSGTISLWCESDPLVTVVPQETSIRPDTDYGEIAVYVDSTAVAGDYDVTVYTQHAGVADTAMVTITLNSEDIQFIIGGGLMDSTGPGKNPPEPYITWLQEHHPEYDLHMDGSWYQWLDTPYGVGVISWRFINDLWDIRTKVTSNPPSTQLLLRKRDNPEPMLCLHRDKNGVITVIPGEDFGVVTQ